MRSLDTDYLVIGTGAMGMAFVDTLLTETDAHIVMVDRYAKPGGHWNVAYPFVTLHQPSAFYGVSSTELSKGRIEQTGLNEGLNELATGAEVRAYFDDVMRHRFLESGRVQYFPLCDYQGAGRFVSTLTGDTYQVQARKVVDATFLNTQVPATHTPNFDIEPGVNFIPLNDLVNVKSPPDGYTIIGGGKTAIDACLWLLEQNVNPDAIRWIMPRDAWLLDRKNTQSTPEFFADSIGTQARQLEAIAKAESISDLFQRLEAAGVLVRIYQDVEPAMFHGATVSQKELAELRRITNVIRLGRVSRLEKNQIVLDQGTIATSDAELHVDCSARAVPNLDTKPIFQGDLITPQTVRAYQPVFSAAFAAHIEASYESEEEKNSLCGVVPLPNHATDWISMTATMMKNQYVWSKHPGISKWLFANRLDGFTRLVATVSEDEQDKIAIMQTMQKYRVPAFEKISRLAVQARQAR